MRGIVFLLFLINGVLSIPIIKPYDDNGCCTSCGYTWCEDLQECVRPWETYCKN
jgi:hypothetical protein